MNRDHATIKWMYWTERIKAKWGKFTEEKLQAITRRRDQLSEPCAKTLRNGPGAHGASSG
jgi:hypothetical protein